MTSRSKDPQSDENNIGWRVVVASVVLPLAWVVTGSMALTALVAGLGALILAQSNPRIAEMSESSVPLRMLNNLAPFIMLAIFVVFLVRNILLL